MQSNRSTCQKSAATESRPDRRPYPRHRRQPRHCRIINRNMLVDCGFAKMTKTNQRRHKKYKTRGTKSQAKTEVAFSAMHHVIGRRIGQKKSTCGGDNKRPIHDPARTKNCRQPAAQRTKQTGENGIRCGQHTCYLDIETVGANQIMR